MSDVTGPFVLPAPFGDGRLRLRAPTDDDVARVTEICRDPALTD